MKWQDVTSTNLKRVGYDKARKVLEIEFHNGREYQYSDVPESAFDELVSADSVGKYFNANIKGRYEFKEIGG